jgi:hypothetical protein
MKKQRMFCSGCHRDVSVMVTDAVVEDTQANVRDQELVCLEIGEWCSGTMCPLGAAAPSAMVSRLIHSGLATDHLRTERGACEACGLETDLALYGRDLAACVVCGTTRPRPARI